MEEKIFTLNNNKIVVKYNSDFSITPYTNFFLDNFPNVTTKKILDFGAGSGVLSFYSHLLNANEIVAYDINKEANKLCDFNVKLNNIKNISICNILNKEKYNDFFDIIISNPASLPTNKIMPSFFDGGYYGNNMIFELINSATILLKNNGVLYFIHTSLVPRSKTENLLINNGFIYEIIAERTIEFREFYKKHISHFIKLSKLFPEVLIIDKNDVMFEVLFLYKAIRKE